jgi:hypothetical protein
MVGVVIACRALSSPWQVQQWSPVSILPAVPEAAPWTVLAKSATEETIYAGASELALHSGDTAHYRDNLQSDRPALWVSIRQGSGDRPEIVCVTADPYEGEALSATIEDIVESVPMPVEVQEWIAAFFGAHHVEREFFKRSRERFDPERASHRRATETDK